MDVSCAEMQGIAWPALGEVSVVGDLEVRFLVHRVPGCYLAFNQIFFQQTFMGHLLCFGHGERNVSLEDDEKFPDPKCSSSLQCSCRRLMWRAHSHLPCFWFFPPAPLGVLALRQRSTTHI